MRFLVPLLIAVLVALMPAAAQAKRVALIIANSKYQHISELSNPANDAKLVEATLQKAGFEAADITVAYDLGYDAMRRAILAFKRKADGADVALIHFAGHGFGGGENFLIPVDAQLRSFHELRDEAFSQRALEDAVSLASGLKLVILDACRNDPSRGRMAGLPANRAVESGLRQVEPESGVLVAYAAKHGTVAQDGPKGGNSPFALALAKHLATPGRDIRFVFGSVRDDVIESTKKEKQEPFLYGSLGGQAVYLVPPRDGPQPPLSAVAQAWSLVKDSEDFGVLEAFRKQFGAQNPLYDALAEQQIVLKKLRYEDKSQRLVRSFAGHSNYVSSVAFSPDGRFALSGSDDNTLKLWDAATGNALRSFTGHSELVASVAFSPDGRFALSGSDDNTLKLWDVSTGKELRSFTGHSSNVTSVAFSPDGRFALSGSADTTLKLWDVASGKELRSFTGRLAPVFSVAFSPDGRFALSGSGDKTLKLWDVATSKELRSFTGHSDTVWSVAFSPDGRFALSSSDDKTLKLWNVATGNALRSCTGHSELVRSVAFSPDGRFALSGSGDKTLKLWDVATGKELRSFAGHSDSVRSIAFSPDGRFALSGSGDKTLKLWDVSEWTAPQAAQPAPLAQSTKPARQDTEPSGTVFKPIIKKD